MNFKILALLLLSFSLLTAQESAISELKNGVLLVRLSTSQNQIDYLLKNGEEKEAKDLENKQKIENDLIMSSFETAYNFSPVYFFYSNNALDISKGNYQNFIFDSNYLPIVMDPGKKVFIAAFTQTVNSRITGLIIYDQQLNQLKKPFPYLTRKYPFLGMGNRSYGDMVEIFNKALQ